MAVDKNRVIADATKFVQKGQLEKAIRAYEKVLGEDPNDVRVLLKVGELHQKRGDQKSAAEVFRRAAEAYAEQGFFLKAVAVLKQLMKLAPDDVRVNERLAGLYQQLGILSDAMGQLQLVAAAAERNGDSGKLLETLRKMVELEPDNVASAVKLGELYAKSEQPQPALEQFRRAAEHLRRNNRADEYLKVAERIAFLEPGDLALTRELANIYLAKGDTKRALAKLQLCFKADPKDLATLNLLAQAFKDLGQVSKTISVYKELAHLYGEQGRAEDVRATWRSVVELAPEDEDAARALGGGTAPAPPPRAPPPRPPPVRAPVAAPAPVPAPAAAGRPLGPEAIAKLITETDVYVKYGLHDKALDHLQKILAIDPDHLEAREKALQIRTARGDAAGAAEEAVRVARVALGRGLDDQARAAVARLRELAPSHPELGALEKGAHAQPAGPEGFEELEEELVLEVEAPAEIEEDGVALAAAEAATDEVVEDELIEGDLIEGEVLEDEVLDDEPIVPPVSSPSPARPPPVPATRAKTSPTPILVIPPPRPEQPFDSASQDSASQDSAESPSLHPSPPGGEGRVGAPVAPPVLRSEVAPAPPPAGPPRAETAPPPAPPEPETDDEVDLDDEIEEIDFFVQQKLYAEASELIHSLLLFHPDHPKLTAKLDDLERRSAPPPPAPPPPAQPQPPQEESFDIARELAEELGAAVPQAPSPDEFQFSVEDVFSQFKKGVEQTVKAEDSETHYDLGIAYKEMGLLDDAVHEFEVALGGGGRKKEIDCFTMIALCRMEKGEPRVAIEAFRRALRSDYITPEAARAVHYELAVAYQASGDSQAALFFLHKVLRVDPGYRDGQAMAARLGGGPGRAPAGEEVRPSTGDAEQRAGPTGGPKKNIGYI